MTYYLRHIAKNGVQSPLPDWNALSFSSIFSDVGSVTFDYAANGVNANLLKDQEEIAVFDDSGEVPDTRAIIEGTSSERFSVEGETYRKLTCRTLWKFLDEGAVYNDGYPNNPGKRVYTSATAGAILDGTLRKAGAMNEIQGLTWSFNATRDSFGNAWPRTLSMELELGVPILQFVQNLVDQGAVEVRMQGRTIVAGAPGKLGTDRSTPGAGRVVLWAAQGATEAPEQTASSGIRTVAIVRGEGTSLVEVVNATAVAKYGRRPVFVNASGVDDAGTLRVIGETTLATTNDVRTERTFRHPIRPGLPVPMRDYLPGDWIATDASSAAAPLDRMRVMQVSITADNAETEGVATLTLNDLFLDRDIQLARKVAGITGGATGSNGVPGSDAEEDLLGPAQVIGLSISSSAYSDPGGINQAQVTALWSAVTQNSDGTPFDDFDHYAVQWRYTTAAADEWSLDMNTSQTRLSWSPVLTGRNVQVRVRAVDRNGNVGLWSEVKVVYTASDTTPPPQPSAPILTPYLGGARAFWDGKGSAGEAMPGDFAYVEVHLSTSATFTPGPTTLYMTTPVGGFTPLTDLDYVSPTYVRFVAVDLASPPNKSAASTAVSVLAERLVEADVANAAITADKVAANAIIVSKIADGAVQAGKLADNAVTVSKVSNGAITEVKIGTDAISTRTLAADSVTAAQIATGAVTASEIAAGAVTAGKIAADAVTATEIRAGSITASSGILGDLAVTSAKIADAAVNNAKIADATIQSAKIASLAAGKITAGILYADITIGARIATALSGARVELNSAGLQAWNSVGTRTVNITSGGDADLQGTFRSGMRNGRRLIISSSLAEAGAGAANQAGLVFDSGSSNLRDSQIYDTGSFLRLDSPAFNTTSAGQGTTLTMGADALKVLISGGYEGLILANSGAFRFGSTDKFFQGNTNGTWHAGHLNDQAIFSTGTELRIRGRSSGGAVGVYLASGSFFDVWGSAYVHGAFNADSKLFVIPHPIREDRMLAHGCTESPQAGVEYWGSTTLGDDGMAEVSLPDYFEALCKPDNRAVLVTPIGTIFPVATSDLVAGKFRVFGQKNRKINWLVKAERYGADFDVEPLRTEYDSTVSPTSLSDTPLDSEKPVVQVPTS